MNTTLQEQPNQPYPRYFWARGTSTIFQHDSPTGVILRRPAGAENHPNVHVVDSELFVKLKLFTEVSGEEAQQILAGRPSANTLLGALPDESNPLDDDIPECDLCDECIAERGEAILDVLAGLTIKEIDYVLDYVSEQVSNRATLPTIPVEAQPE